MFQIKISDIGAHIVADDHTVLRADTRHALKEKVHQYLSTTYARRWDALDPQERQRLKERVGEAVDKR